MNTSLTYLYRDAGNWKQFKTIILRGSLSQEDKDTIQSKLRDGLYFLPEQVGLKSLQAHAHDLNELDHIWHEFDISSVAPSEEKPTELITASRLVRNFQELEIWNEERAYRRLFGTQGKSYGW
jgi:hypothetical protein